jgi:hypothetical protein
VDNLSEHIEALQNLLNTQATGGIGDNRHYQALRQEVVNNPVQKDARALVSIATWI